VGAVIFGLGLIILTALHIMLMVRQRKFIFTFLPVLFIPPHELLEKERLMRKYAVYLCLIGAVPILLSFLYR
jgi:hypothetical protein